MLTTLQRVSAWKAIAGFEHLALECLAAASEYFEREVGRTLDLTTYTGVYLHGDGTPLLYPPQWPVTAVTSLSVEESTWTVLSDGVADTGQEAYLPPGGMHLLARAGRVWPDGDANILITYSAGYAVIPEDIQTAVVMVTQLLLDERTKLGTGGKTMGDLTVQQVVRSHKEYPLIRDTIRRHRTRGI